MTFPSGADQEQGRFDRFAAWVATQVARTPFFVFCVMLVAVWLPSFPLFGDFNTWSLVINGPTTILTFLLVAILENSTARADKAVQAKLNALADALSDLLESTAGSGGRDGLRNDARELREAVGLEDRVSS